MSDRHNCIAEKTIKGQFVRQTQSYCGVGVSVCVGAGVAEGVIVVHLVHV